MPPEKQEPKHVFAEASLSTDELAARLRDVENQLAAARAATPTGLIPEHGAGPGLAINQTWSQADQEAARAGKP